MKKECTNCMRFHNGSSYFGTHCSAFTCAGDAEEKCYQSKFEQWRPNYNALECLVDTIARERKDLSEKLAIALDALKKYTSYTNESIGLDVFDCIHADNRGNSAFDWENFGKYADDAIKEIAELKHIATDPFDSFF